MIAAVAAHEDLQAAEAALRELVRVVLGDGWLQAPGLNSAKRRDIQRRRDADQERRHGVVVPTDLIEFTELAELKAIILKNWAAFAPALLDEDTTRVYLERLVALRHPDAHVRGLLPFEEHLASGISGLFRNLVTTYRSRMDPISGLWPVVESITDSLGNTKTHGDIFDFQSLAVIRVGEKLTYRCRGSDPDGRPLHWRCLAFGGPQNLLGEAHGDEAEFVWQVTRSSIGELHGVLIELSSDRDHHRHGNVDEQLYFRYTVVPSA